MSHANARTNEFGRLLMVQRVAAGHRPGEVAKQLGVSRQTIYKWVRRHAAEGVAGLADRSSRPHRSPCQTPARVEARIVAARVAHFAGPVALSARLGLPASTIGAVIARHGLPRLSQCDRITGEIVTGRRWSQVRYEHPYPGSLLHVDVKKLGRIPPGGGWRAHGRSEAVRGRGNGWDFVHVAVDDHSRVAYCEVHSDEKAVTCAGFLARAHAWFATQDVTVERVLTDNAKAYRGHAWNQACDRLQVRPKYIKKRCPWTNGKAERFNRTLLTEWAYARPWTRNSSRTRALDTWLRHYNTRRGHSGIGGATPASRLP
jgi:transposase InsO family protein